MNDQDKRAVEGMARCGIDFDGLCKAFPNFPIDEIERVYMQIRKMGNSGNAEQDIKRAVPMQGRRKVESSRCI